MRPPDVPPQGSTVRPPTTSRHAEEDARTYGWLAVLALLAFLVTAATGDDAVAVIHGVLLIVCLRAWAVARHAATWRW